MARSADPQMVSRPEAHDVTVDDGVGAVAPAVAVADASLASRPGGAVGDRRPIALFDFDGTLTRCDSLLPFLRFAVGRARFVAGFAAAAPWILAWKAGLIDNGRAKRRLLGAALAGAEQERLAALGATFAAEVVPRLLCPAAMRRLRAHQRAGHAVWIVSASPEIYLLPWATGVGIDGVLASRFEFRDGRFTGALLGANCFGPEKLRRAEAALGRLGGRIVHAYGDTAGDREMLAAASHPHFRRFHARRRGGRRSFVRAIL
jgi:phosphatidylglycerophosphatase C